MRFPAVRAILKVVRILNENPPIGRSLDRLSPEYREFAISFDRGAYGVFYSFDEGHVLRAFSLRVDIEETGEVRLFLAKTRLLLSCLVSTGSENALAWRFVMAGKSAFEHRLAIEFLVRMRLCSHPRRNPALRSLAAMNLNGISLTGISIRVLWEFLALEPQFLQRSEISEIEGRPVSLVTCLSGAKLFDAGFPYRAPFGGYYTRKKYLDQDRRDLGSGSKAVLYRCGIFFRLCCGAVVEWRRVASSEKGRIVGLGLFSPADSTHQQSREWVQAF